MNDASPELMSLFCGALERVAAGERAAYLEAACGQDGALRARVEALLRAHEAPGGFLPEQPGARDPGSSTREQRTRAGPTSSWSWSRACRSRPTATSTT